MRDLYFNPTYFDWRLKIHLTFKCNLKCSYCTIPCKIMPKCKELSAKEWYENINRLKIKTVLTGGEPTLYQDIYELINNIDNDISISLFSNLTFDVKQFAKNVKRNVGFYFSFHPEGVKLKEFTEKIKELETYKHLNTFSIHSPVKNKHIKYWKAEFVKLKKQGIDIRIDPNFDDIMPKNLEKVNDEVLCERESYLFNPDGKRYMCVKHMMTETNSVGHITDKNFVPKIQQWCSLYPTCNKCDFQMYSFIRRK